MTFLRDWALTAGCFGKNCDPVFPATAAAQSGTTFRLKGRGMPHLRGNAHGDQLIRVQVEVPAHLSSEQKKILEDFARVSGDTDEPMAKSFFEKAKKFF